MELLALIEICVVMSEFKRQRIRKLQGLEFQSRPKHRAVGC